MRFLSELRYFWAEVRNGYPRQRMRERFYQRYKPLLSIELASATEEECLKAAIQIAKGGDDIADATWVFGTLLSRIGRAKDRPGRPAVTIDDVVMMFER